MTYRLSGSSSPSIHSPLGMPDGLFCIAGGSRKTNRTPPVPDAYIEVRLDTPDLGTPLGHG